MNNQITYHSEDATDTYSYNRVFEKIKGFNHFFTKQKIIHGPSIIKRLKEDFSDIGDVEEVPGNILVVTYFNSVILVKIQSSIGKGYNKCVIEAFYDIDDKIKIQNLITELFKKYSTTSSLIRIHWWYTSPHGIDYSTMIEPINDVFFYAAYPQINLKDYVDKYLESKESVILLKGNPGTGKSRFIRYILNQISLLGLEDEESCVSYTNDNNVITNSQIYMDFLSSSNLQAIILEDCDYNLDSRKDGNADMAKLLSASDGIITSNNKKIIISTNLRNLTSIDEALLRPGRCHDVLEFRALTQKEINKLSEEAGVDPPILEGDSMYLSEFYKYYNEKK